MEQLNHFLKCLVSTSGFELHLEPNRKPYIVSAGGVTDLDSPAMPGTEISGLVFPIIPPDVRHELPNQPLIKFIHPHNLGKFDFTVQKTPNGFSVTVRPLLGDQLGEKNSGDPSDRDLDDDLELMQLQPSIEIESSSAQKQELASIATTTEIIAEIEPETEQPLNSLPADIVPELYVVSANDPAFQTQFSDNSTYEPPGRRDDVAPQKHASSSHEPEPAQQNELPDQRPEPADAAAPPLVDRRTATSDRRKVNMIMTERMDAMFRQMAEVGASDLHLSVSMPPMIRKDGKMQRMECAETELTEESMRELLHSIMPLRNQDEFIARHDTDFAYEIQGLARFRCNVFMDRKGMGGVFRIIPAKMTSAEQLGLSKAILDLCELSKGLVVVTGPTGSGKSTTLCAMVNHINMNREDHIITIEDPIEFVHENQKCLVNQREVHNHTDSFKDALRAALREDPDILLVGEMRDLETISIAIETAETGHLVFGTLHTTTAPSTVDRIIDQFPADRQQQIRVMLSESLKGVIAQTLLPKIGGGRVAALEVLIVTPAISNLIREGKTFQIQSAMQTGKNHGMVMLNDSLFDLVQKGTVEPRDAYIKAVDKANFETMLTRGGFKI
jgi:twitching motility protein PilT